MQFGGHGEPESFPPTLGDFVRAGGPTPETPGCSFGVVQGNAWLAFVLEMALTVAKSRSA